MNPSDRQRAPSPTHHIAAESLAVWLFSAAAVLAPVALGGTWVWARLALEATMAIAIVAWVASARRPLGLVLLPLAIAGLVLLQLVPLPDRVLAFLAPMSAGGWKVVMQGLPRTWGTVSVVPAATAVGMQRLLLSVATIAAVADLSRRLPLRRQLTWAIAVSAAVIWCLGLAFPVDKHDRVMLGFLDLKGPIKYWKTPVEEPLQTSGFGHPDQVTVAGMTYVADGWAIGDGFGSYICSNHFAGAVCLTLPVALALGLALTARWNVIIRFGVTAIVFVAAVWTTGIAAGSRAGAVALVVAGLVLGAFTAPLRWQRRLAGGVATTIIGAVVAGLALLIAVDPPPGLEGRLPGPLQRHAADLLHDGRIEAARSALRMFRTSPLLGTGLDTFGELQPRFMPRRPPLYFAHNDCAQLLAETGITGAVVAAVLLWALIRCGRGFLRRPVTVARLLHAGPWAAVAGIGFHSLFDWNLHVPANGFLACLVAGMAVGSAFDDGVSPGASRQGWFVGLGLAAASLCAFVFAARDARSTAACRTLSLAIASARLAEQQGTPTAASSELQDAIKTGEGIARLDPANARLAVLLGQASLHLAAAVPSQVAEAEHWFRAARTHAAIIRGVAEPIPSPPLRSSP